MWPIFPKCPTCDLKTGWNNVSACFFWFELKSSHGSRVAQTAGNVVAFPHMKRFVSAFLFTVLVGHGSLLAQLPVARLLTVFPPGGKVGSQFEISLTGVDLDEANQLHFSHPGITAKLKVGETNGLPEANKFLVTIATNVTPGVYEARVVGRFGISNPRSFV